MEKSMDAFDSFCRDLFGETHDVKVGMLLASFLGHIPLRLEWQGGGGLGTRLVCCVMAYIARCPLIRSKGSVGLKVHMAWTNAAITRIACYLLHVLQSSVI